MGKCFLHRSSFYAFFAGLARVYFIFLINDNEYNTIFDFV